MPFGIVAIDPETKRFVGFISAVFNKSFPNSKSPWITNLYVAREYRKKKVASTLIEMTKRVLANILQFQDVFLWSDDQSLTKFYINQGFNYYKSIEYEGFDMNIFKTDIYPTNVSLIQPVHFTGLIVIIMIIIFFKAGIRFIYRLLFDWSIKKE
jgi:GNAT superfamily N-acetyltransferase